MSIYEKTDLYDNGTRFLCDSRITHTVKKASKHDLMQKDAQRIAYQYLIRRAFDQYNAVALMGQLKKLLPEETWQKLESLKVPQIVNDGWMSMSKKDRRSKR